MKDIHSILPVRHGIKRVGNDFLHTMDHMLDLPKAGFMLCTRGEMVISDGKNFYDFKSGDLYIYAPSTQIFVRNWTQDFSAVIGIVDIEFAIPILAPILSAEKGLTIFAQPCVALNDMQMKGITDLSDIYTQRKLLPDDAIRVRLLDTLAAAICYDVALAYQTHVPKQPCSSTRADKIFLNFVFSLKDNISEHHDVMFYAGKQNLTPKYFSSLIKERSGKFAGEWISLALMSKAKILLRNHQMSIKEIAYSLGFPTQANFGRFFKRYSGLPPSKYK